MKLKQLLFALFAALALFSPAHGETFFLGGIQVNEADHDHWVSTLKKVGMNTVSVTVYAHHGDWDSANLWYDDKNDAVVSEIRAAKRQNLRVVLILRVALDHAFKRNRFLWHGMIMPKTDEQLDEWFRRYGLFVRKWAEIAEQEGVDVLGVGSEMNSLTSTIPVPTVPDLEEYYLDQKKQKDARERVVGFRKSIPTAALSTADGSRFDSVEKFFDSRSEIQKRWAETMARPTDEKNVAYINARRRALQRHWIVLIANTRTQYSGKLSYAANFDQYESVGFWKHLDYIGINAYFPLRQELELPTSREALYDTVEQSWIGVLDTIEDFRIVNDLWTKPVIFTELGYTSRKHSTLQPWASDGFSLVGEAPDTTLVVWKKQPIDSSERVIALRALRNASAKVNPKLLSGILYWKLSTIGSHREIEPFVHIIGDRDDAEFGRELSLFANKPTSTAVHTARTAAQ